MKKKLRKIIKFLLHLPIKISILFGSNFSNLISKYSKKLFWEDELENSAKHIHKIQLGDNLNLKFYVINSITKFRAETFFDKEPDTIKWIKNYNGDGDFIDIGANIGIYSNYFAKINKGHVHAFESSFYNLPLLAKNCQLNKNENKITIYPFPLFDENKCDFFKINETIQGGALSSFGVDYGHDGNTFSHNERYLMPGFNLDYLIDNKIILKVPSLIKIDVDGVEDLILKGGRKTIKNNTCISVLVEVNEKFGKQFELIQKIMSDSGFNLYSSGKKTNLDQLRMNKDFENTYNQIWNKS